MSSPLTASVVALKQQMSKTSAVKETIQFCSKAQREVITVHKLELECDDHHFAPGQEYLSARYKATGLEDDTLVLRILARNGAVVYEVSPTANDTGTHPIGGLAGWNGRGNRNAYQNRFLTPLDSPYKITVDAPGYGFHVEEEFRVYYRGLTLALGTYTEDGAAPVQAAEPQKWVQYKLNELGYFSGPVDGVIGAQTTRALKRYAHQHPNLQENQARLANFYTNAALQTALNNNEQARNVLAGLPGSGHSAKIYIDHNHFYTNMDEFCLGDGNVRMDKDKLDRCEFPIEATVTLVSKHDANGTGAGVVSPEATGVVPVQWFVNDTAEDTSTLLTTTPTRPTRAKDYVDRALQTTIGANGDNCHEDYGGFRKNPGQSNRNYFRMGGLLPPFTSTNNGDDVFTDTYQGAVGSKRGKAGVLFLGSYIAGDDFTIKAQVTFEGLADKVVLEGEHQSLMGAGWKNNLSATTGRIVVWRRISVAAVIEWPAPAHAITWPSVAAEYAHAYCELTGPSMTITAANFIANYIPVHAASLFKRQLNSDLALKTDGSEMALTTQAIFNLTIPAQGPKEYAREYKQRVQSMLRTALDLEATNPRHAYRSLLTYAETIAGFVSAQHPPGAVVIHAKWVPTISITHHPKFGFGDPVADTFDPGLSCLGLPYGVVILSHSMYPDYRDQFVVTHEVGHTRFLRHHETGGKETNAHFNAKTSPSANPTDHDLTDHNCMMCYPWGIPSRNYKPLFEDAVKVDWGPASAERAAFCGKCLLKLRGWNAVHVGLPPNS